MEIIQKYQPQVYNLYRVYWHIALTQSENYSPNVIEEKVASCLSGNINLVLPILQCIDKKFDNLLLNWSVMMGHSDIAEFLVVYRKCDIHQGDALYPTEAALIYAAMMGRLDIIQFLVKFGAKIKNAGIFFLNNLAIFGHIAILRLMFLEFKWLDHYETEQIEHVFKYSVIVGNLDVVKFFVMHLKCNIHLNNDMPLKLAVQFEHPMLIMYFLEKSCTSPFSSETMDNLLALAASLGNLDIVRLLVNNKANINANDDRAMIMALEKKQYHIVAYLSTIAAGIN